MPRRREVIGPDGTIYPDLASAATAAGVKTKTMEGWAREGRNGWVRGRMVGVKPPPPEPRDPYSPAGAIVAPVSILTQRPVDRNDGRFWR